MSEPMMDEVVGRVREKLDRVGGSDFHGSHYFEMRSEDGSYVAAIHEDDLRALLAAYQSVREDKARLDWLEDNADRISGPAHDTPRFVCWAVESGPGVDHVADTLREVVALARTGGTE